jgi:hypothetical protein
MFDRDRPAQQAYALTEGRAAAMYGPRHYGIRLLRSERRVYVVARSLVVAALVLLMLFLVLVAVLRYL